LKSAFEVIKQERYHFLKKGDEMSKVSAIHFVYNGFCEYEVALTCSLVAAHGSIHTASLARESVVGEGGLRVSADFDLSEVQIENYDLLLISGMLDGSAYWEKLEIFAFIEKFNRAGKCLASICGGPLFLAKAGALRGKNYTCGIPQGARQSMPEFGDANYIDQDVVMDGNLITAKGYATVGLSLAVAEKFNLLNLEQQKDFANYWGKKESLSHIL
jgi:4-methyl-5(b-hydroxyethyl)-thiazole monophosphate biosynthesis